MMTLFLYAPTQADMDAALLAAGVVDDEGIPVYGYSVDQIGPFTRDDVEYLDWHTNLCGSFTEEQLALFEPLRVYPTVPYRVFG